jgi:hypothetical protein
LCDALKCVEEKIVTVKEGCLYDTKPRMQRAGILVSHTCGMLSLVSR